MNKWQCANCEYIYDPEEGDYDSDVEAGTPFEDLPKKWVCPECGARKDKFERYTGEEERESSKEEEE